MVVLSILRKSSFYGFLSLFLILTSCGESDDSTLIDNAESDLPGILKRGKIVVLAENSTASFFIYKGRKMGFEFEVLEDFARDLGIALEIRIVHDLNDMREQLLEGEADIMACNFTVTRERKKSIVFSRPYLQTDQVLIQRKRKPHTMLTNYTITDPLQMAKKRITVREGSSYYERLLHLQDEIGDTILIRKTNGNESVEELIQQVSEGQIDYTVAERNVAKMNTRIYDNLDLSVAISFKQNIAFALRNDAPLLKKQLDDWLGTYMQQSAYNFKKQAYFEPKEIKKEIPKKPFMTRSGGLSPFDGIMKIEAANFGYDWRLLAALIYQESSFNPTIRSFYGSYGLMQFMPGTGPSFGVFPNSPPDVQIRGGLKYLKVLRGRWSHIQDEVQREKFVLASYNAGIEHIKDAQRLASKHGLDPLLWDDHVAIMVKNLGKREYYTDPVVKYGAVRNKTFQYVQEIMLRYQNYKDLFKP